MAEFGIQATELSAPQGAGANPIAPATASFLDNGVGQNIAGIMDVFQKGLESDAKARKEAAKNAVLKEYSKRQGAINDAASTAGGLTSNEAARRSRALFNEFLAANPEYATDLRGVATGFKDFSQMGESLEDVQDEKTLRKQLIGKMQGEGWNISLDMSEQAQASAIRAYQTGKRAEEQFKQQVERNNEMRASTRFSRETAEAEQKQTSQRILSDVGVANLEAFISFGDDLSSRVKAGTLDMTTAQRELGKSFSRIEQQIVLASATNPELASSYRTLFDNARKTALLALDPKADAENLKAQYDASLYQAKLLASNQPGVMNRVAVAGMFNNDPALVMKLAGDAPKLVDVLDKITNQEPGPFSPQIIGTENEKPTLELLSKNIKKLQTGQAKEGTEGELVNSTRHVLAQFGKLQGQTGVSPENLQTLVDFISSSDYGWFASKNPLNREEIQPAINAYQMYYEGPAVRSIEEAIAGAVTTKKVPKLGIAGSYYEEQKTNILSDNVKANVDGNTVSFVMKDGSSSGAVDTLNKASKGLNKLIRTAAHLEGRTDYGKFFEERKYTLLPSLFPIKPGTIVNGYKYVDGDWRDKNSYTKIGGEGE